jgi:hypothetical protein
VVSGAGGACARPAGDLIAAASPVLEGTSTDTDVRGFQAGSGTYGTDPLIGASLLFCRIPSLVKRRFVSHRGTRLSDGMFPATSVRWDPIFFPGTFFEGTRALRSVPSHGPGTLSGFISSHPKKDLPEGRREPCPCARSVTPMLDSGEMADARARRLDWQARTVSARAFLADLKP